MNFRFIIFSISLLLTFVLGYVNYQIYLNKNEGYVYKLSSYNDVYYLRPLPAISEFKGVDTDSLEVIVTGKKNQEWNIYDIEKNTGYKTYGSPKIYLPQNTVAYIENLLIANQDSTFSFTIEVQRQIPSGVHVIKSSIPVINEQSYNFSDFCNIDWVEQKDKDTVMQILKKDLKIDTCKNTLSKIELLSVFLRNSIKKHKGAKFIYQWNNYSAWFIYSKGASGESSLQCNEYAEVFYLFANVAGIQTRRVAVTGWASSDATVKLTGHHFNESYIPEQKKWAFVDLTTDKAYVRNDTGEVLNTYELFVSNISNNYSNLTLATSEFDTISYVPYKNFRHNEEYYFNRDCLIQYKYGENRFEKLSQIKRYTYVPEPVLSLNYTNRKLYIKNILLILNVFTFLLTVLFGTTLLLIKIRTRSLRKVKPTLTENL